MYLVQEKNDDKYEIGLFNRNDCGGITTLFGTCTDSLISLTCPDGSPGSGVVSPTSLVYTCSGSTISFTPGSAEVKGVEGAAP